MNETNANTSLDYDPVATVLAPFDFDDDESLKIALEDALHYARELGDSETEEAIWAILEERRLAKRTA